MCIEAKGGRKHKPSYMILSEQQQINRLLLSFATCALLLLTNTGQSRGCLRRHVGAKLSSVSCLVWAPITAFIMAQPWFPPSLSVPLGEWGSGITHIRACIINACSGLKSQSKWDTKLAVGCMIQTSHHSRISMQDTKTQHRGISLSVWGPALKRPLVRTGLIDALPFH